MVALFTFTARQQLTVAGRDCKTKKNRHTFITYIIEMIIIGLVRWMFLLVDARETQYLEYCTYYYARGMRRYSTSIRSRKQAKGDKLVQSRAHRVQCQLTLFACAIIMWKSILTVNLLGLTDPVQTDTMRALDSHGRNSSNGILEL